MNSSCKFITDVMLGKLARWLRILGYDTICISDTADKILQTAKKENRIILTRDTAFFKRIIGAQAVFVSSDNYRHQLMEIKTTLGLSFSFDRIFSRCSECNGSLEKINKEDADGLVPPFILQTETRFSRCSICGRIYWEGSHTKRIKKNLAELNAATSKFL